jgi:hypothetical protein
MTFMGSPIVEIPDLTNSVWIMLDTTAACVKHKIIRDFAVEFHHNEGDSQVYKITTGSTLVFEQPIWSGYMTGLS